MADSDRLNWQVMQHFEEGYAVDYSLKQLPSALGYLGAFRSLLAFGRYGRLGNM